MIRRFSLTLLIVLTVVSIGVYTYGKDDEKDFTDIEDIKLEDLLNQDLVSASKKSESLFDSPLSASVITRQEIERAGATSIMEALRLVPGIIVREQTPGNYDIHLRGFDNIPPNTSLPIASNLLTLVMIDNRVVYNYINGGTFWESLPIDLNDVERIEVIRGPSSALYGPNAVTGVINIITRRPDKDGLYSVANVQGGSYESYIANGSIGYKKGKFSSLFSANYTHRNRMQTTYFDYYTQSYVNANELHSSSNQLLEDWDYLYGDSSLSLKKYGFNGFLDYNPSESVHIGISGGYQDSTSRKAFMENFISPLLLHKSKTKYIDFNLNASGFNAKLSYLFGTHEFIGSSVFDSDLKNFDAVVDYEWIGKNFSIRPGFAYSNINYEADFVGGEKTIETLALSLRTEFNPIPELRLVGAIRGDKYSNKDKFLFTYQLASTYKFNDKNLVRAVFSQAIRSSFMVDTFLTFGSSVWGNPDLEPATINMVELGYRAVLSEQFQLDMEAAYSSSKNFDAIVSTPQISGFANLPVKAYQGIFTVTLNFTPNSRFNAKLFGSLQRTELKDFTPSLSNIDETVDIQHKNTPTLYGGAIFNYIPAKKWNINTNVYYYTGYTYDRQATALSSGDSFDGIADVSGKILFNVKASYQIAKGLSLYVNARNLFNNDDAEFAFTDIIKSTFLAGMNFELK